MALVPWEDIKTQVGYDSLSDQDKIDNINKYSRYVQEYYTQVEPRDPREVGQATDEFVGIAAKDVLGDLGPVERASAFLGNIYKGAAGTFTSAFRSAALAQQVIGEQLGSYDDDSPVAERDLYKIAQNIDESVRETTGIEDPRLRGEFINTLVPQGLGSALAFLGTAAAAAAAAPASAAGAVGLGTAAGVGALSTSGSLYEEARQYGANEFVARGAAAMGVPIGLTEAIPLGKFASRLTAGVAKRAILGGIVEGATEEAVQEGFSQAAQNVVASRLAGYDPERSVTQGVLESAAVGLVTGGLIGGGVNAITRDNEAFYGEQFGRQVDQEIASSVMVGEERARQVMALARNAGEETRTETDPVTGEQVEVKVPVNVFGRAEDIPEIGSDPEVNSVPVPTIMVQDGDGNTVTRKRYKTPSNEVWQAEYRAGVPVSVTDVTQEYAKEQADALRETDARLLREAQTAVLTGRTMDAQEPTTEVPRVPERDQAGVDRQEKLTAEIGRLYKIRDDILASRTLTGQENVAGGMPEGDPNTAREVIRYGPEGRIEVAPQARDNAVRRINRMIAVRERELRGLKARPEGYIMASQRDVPPTEGQKRSLVQGFQNLFDRITSPALRNEISFEVGDIQPLIDSGRLPEGSVAYFEKASNGRKAMVFLSDKLATLPTAQREILHELGHAFYDTLPAPLQEQLGQLWQAETSGRTGPLFDDNGGLLPEVSTRVMTIPQEWFSERLSWSNDNWAKGRSEAGVMNRVGGGFRNLLDRFLRYTGHGDRINLEFKAFLNQGDRFSRLRQGVQAAAGSTAGGGAGPDELNASVRFKYQRLIEFVRANRGGFTVDPTTFSVPQDGFVVAPTKKTEDALPLDLPPEVQKNLFRKYINAHRKLFEQFEGQAHLGGWLRTKDKNGNPLPVQDQAFVLDVSFVVDNKADALYLAQRGEQEAIFDLANGDEIQTAAGISGLPASDILTPERRGELGRMGGQADYLAGRERVIRRAAQRLGLRVPDIVQEAGGEPQAGVVQEAGPTEVRPSVRGIASVQSVPLRQEGVRVGERPQVIEVAEYLQNRSLEYLQQPLTQDSPADVRLSQFLINAWPEVSYQLQQEENGLTWYTEDITQMEADLRRIFPSSLRSDVRQRLFKAILTPLSYGQNPKDETSTALRVWEDAGESFPLSPRQSDGKGWTRRAEIVEKGFMRLNRLVKEMGERRAADWLLAKHPISELRKYNPNVAGKMNDLAMGSQILGPKGGDYFANMNGISEELTSDLHFNRMWNRMMGTLIDPKTGEIVEAPRNESERNLQDRAVGLASQELGLTKSELQAVLWVYEIGLWKDLGARLNYYKHSDGTRIALEQRGIRPREVVRDRGAIEERRQTALGRSDALSRAEGQGQVLPEVRASVRGDQFQRVLEPVIQFGKRNLRTGGALPYEMFRTIEQQGFNINEKMVRAQNAVDDLEAAIKKVTGKNLSQLTEPQIKRLNDALQNPSVRANLNPQIAVAIGNMRNLLDSLSSELIRSGAIPDNLVPVVTANMGVYLHRSYEKWENPKYQNPFNSLPKEVQNRLQTIVREYAEKKFAANYAKQQSLARGEESINPESDQYKADFQAGIQQARAGGIDVKAEIDALAQPESDSPFGQLGSVLTKDLSIITARKDIPPEVRMLWGEIKDPRVNFLKSVSKMAGLLETHNMLKNLRDAGMGSIFFPNPRGNFTVKLVTDGSRTASPLNMFVEGMRNDVYTSQEIADALKDTFGRGAQPETFMEKVTDYYLRLNGFSKFAKTVLSVQTQVRNVIGNGMFLVANGYVFSPDANTAVRTLKQLAIPGAATYLGLGRDANMRNYVAKLTKLGILGQSVYASELESYFKNAQVNTAQDIFDNHFIGAIKTIGRGATKAYQLGDAIPKIIAYEVELSRLRRAFPATPVSSLERQAADKVLNSLPTYSRIPRLGNFLRQQPFVGAFISFPLEVVRTGYNLLSTINEELRSPNTEVRKTGAYRLVGTMMASAGFSAVASALAFASGIDDEEDMAIRKLDAPWDRYSTKLYLGRDSRGNVQQVNLSYVDPYNYLRDPIIALAKADGSWERRFLEAVKTGFEPFYGEQILASKVLDIARNKKGTTGGRVFNPEAPLPERSAAIAGHLFDAFNLGTITSADRIYKGLTGQVTQTGRAYDPALEALATVTGQRVVTVDSRQALGFAARRFNNRLNDATGIFTAAFYDQSRTTPEARLEAYRGMVAAREKIFRETSDIISAAIRLGLSRGEVIRILREQSVSQENAQALTAGLVTEYKPRRELRGEVSRYRQQATSTR